MDKFDELLESIRQRLAGQTARVRELVSMAAAVSAESTQFSGSVITRGFRNGAYAVAHTHARNGLSHAVDLGHECEVALSVGYVLEYIGIDLGHLVEETDVGGGSMGQVWVGQRGAASIFSAGAEPSEAVIAPGEIGIQVPLRLIFFGQVREIDLHLNLIVARSPQTGLFQTRISRGPHIQPLLDTPAMTLRLIQAVNDQVAPRLAKPFPAPPSADLGAGDPQYYSAELDSSGLVFHLFGTFGHKRRSVSARIKSLPDWASLTFKLRTAVFANLVAREVRRARASMSAISYLPDNRFRFTAHGSDSKSKRIWGVKFRVKVSVTFFLEGALTVGGTTIHLRVREYREKDVDVRYRPRAIDFLIGWTQSWVARFIERMIPAIRLNESFWVPDAQRLAVDLSNESFKIHMKL